MTRRIPPIGRPMNPPRGRSRGRSPEVLGSWAPSARRTIVSRTPGTAMGRTIRPRTAATLSAACTCDRSSSEPTLGLARLAEEVRGSEEQQQRGNQHPSWPPLGERHVGARCEPRPEARDHDHCCSEQAQGGRELRVRESDHGRDPTPGGASAPLTLIGGDSRSLPSRTSSAAIFPDARIPHGAAS